MRVKVTSKICMTKDLGTHGNLFGGNMLAWMDEAAAIYAMQVTKMPRIVSIKFAEIVFKQPVLEDDIICFFCEKPKKGNTSVTFDIFADVNGNEVFRTACTFVALDKYGRPHNIKWENVDNKYFE
ncbi:hotdog domain-containing protein [Lentisphaerota bacterium ZTH]|nr:acyl-CoA thioesterase [Lentisphaerota bacterium]WET05465.1 hotdog domain-containing protein [Lentisphaerota bacterium ZTH]